MRKNLRRTNRILFELCKQLDNEEDESTQSLNQNESTGATESSGDYDSGGNTVENIRICFEADNIY